MEPLVGPVGNGGPVDDDDDEPERPPVALRSPGPAARTPRLPARPGRMTHEPRTLVVDPRAPDAYREIDRAVADARHGDRVVIRPGTYRQPVVVDRAVELIGVGPRASIVLEPAGAEALSMCASGAVVRNLSIRPALVGNDGMAWSAVWVRDVAVTIEDCDLSSHLGATVWVGGSSSRAIVRRCLIHDGAQNGVAARDEGTVLVEDCDVTGNRWPGVFAGGPGSSATVRRSRITDNFDIGALANASATLVVEHSRLARNAHGGVMLDGAAPASGIEHNEVETNAEEGILVLAGVGGLVRDNRLHRNQLGIVVAGGASPGIAGNEVVDTLGPAILVTGARSDPWVSDNTLVAPRAAAIVVRDEGAGRFERNRITAGRQPGVWILEHGSSPIFMENTISGGRLIAIAVTGHAGGLFERNDLRGNTGGSWDLDDAGPVELRGNLEDPRPVPLPPESVGYVN